MTDLVIKKIFSESDNKNFGCKPNKIMISGRKV